MADLSKTIDLIFNGVDNTGTAIKSVNSNISKLEGSIAPVVGPLANLADGILTAEAAMLSLGLVVGAFALNESIQFESALVDLEKVLSQGEGDASDYSDAFERLSNKFGESITNVVQSTATFKQSNFDISESLLLVEAALTATRTSEIEMGEATELLVAIIRGFGGAAADVVPLLDILTQVSNNFGTNLTELAKGMAKISPVAGEMGFSMEELAALLTPVITNTRSGTEAARGLQSGLASLITETATTSKAFEILGISQRDSNGEMRSAREILADVQGAYAGLTAEQKTQVALLIAQKDNFAKFKIVLGETGQQQEILASLTEKGGAAQRELAIALDQSQVALDRFSVALKNASISVGDEYREATADAVNATTELVKAFAGVVDSGGLEPLFNALRPLIAGFAEDVQEIARLLPDAFANVDFSNLLQSLDNLGAEVRTVFTNIFDDIDLTTPDGLADGLQRVVDIIAALTNTTAGIINQFQPIFEAIGEAARRVGEAEGASSTAAGNLLGAIKLIGDFGLVAGGALNVIKESGTDIQNVFDLIIGAVRVAVNGLQVAFDQLAIVFFGTLASLANGLDDLTLGLLPDEFQEFQKQLELLTGGAFENMKRNAAEGVQGLVQMGEGLSLVAREAKPAATEVEEFAEAARKVASEGEAANQRLQEWQQGIDKFLESKRKEVVVTEDSARQTSSLVAIYDEATGKITGYTDGLKGISTGYEGVSKSTQQAVQDGEAFQTKMLEIASNERIANIEASVDLNIAKIEADAKVAQAIIEGLASTITSTGDLLGGLFGNLSDSGGLDKLAIKRQIDKENELRERATKDQTRLINEQIKLLKARSQALTKGDALIKVQADGITPALEMIFHEVLKLSQVRATAEGAELLLGFN